MITSIAHMAYYSCQVISDPKTSPATVPIISTLPNLLYTVCRSGVGLIAHLDLGSHFVNDQNLSFAATTAQSVPCLCFLPRATSLAINRAICFTHLGGVSNDTSLTSTLSHSNHPQFGFRVERFSNVYFGQYLDFYGKYFQKVCFL